MIKIYLDQKDYINIANGLLGDNKYDEDVECYNFLLKLVADGKVRIYYSWVHFSETFKYGVHVTESLTKQCEVLEELTKDHCLLQIQNIILTEVQNYLLKEFKGISDSDIDQGYPYGTGVDCIEFDMNFVKLRNNMPNSIKKQTKTNVLSMPQKEYDKLIPNSDRMPREDVVKVLTFDEIALKKYFDETLGFKSLFLRYRSLFVNDLNPNITPINKSKELLAFMDSIRKLMIRGDYLIQKQKTNHEKRAKKIECERDLKVLIKNLIDGMPEIFRKVVKTSIKPFLKSNSIDEKKAIQKLGNFNEIMSSKYYIDLIQQYIQSNSGFSPNPRKLDENDYFDIEHLRNLPYVDCYVTEKYFGNIAQGICSKYGTSVFKNLKDLKTHLEQVT